MVALYHDQGLIPIKVLEPDRAVNLTLGLPYVRTSPDHGTAFDRAGHWSGGPDQLHGGRRAGRAPGRARQGRALAGPGGCRVNARDLLFALLLPAAALARAS